MAFESETNGLKEAFLKVGRRSLCYQKHFFVFLEKRQQVTQNKKAAIHHQ